MPDLNPFRAALAQDPEWAYGDLLPIRTRNGGQEIQPALPGFLRNSLIGLGDLITGPATGTVTPDATMSLIDIATMGLGPKGSVGVFGGKLGAGRHAAQQRMALTRAENMELAAKGNEEIWQATGWFRGVDGKWKYEIPDTGAAVNTDALTLNPFTKEPGKELYGLDYNKPKPLKDILSHPDLYSAYPEIGEMPVKAMPLGSILSGTTGAHVPSENAFYLSQLRPAEARKTLLHEVQHAIQEREGFARGGNSREFLPEGHAEGMNEAYTNLRGHRTLLEDAGVNYISLEWALDDLARGITPPEHQLANWKKAKDAGLLDDYHTLWQKYAPFAEAHNKAVKSYRNLAGEVESRNVETRAEHPGTARRADWGFPLATKPERGTMDTAPREQIIVFPTPKPVEHDPFRGASHK